MKVVSAIVIFCLEGDGVLGRKDDVFFWDLKFGMLWDTMKRSVA